MYLSTELTELLTAALRHRSSTITALAQAADVSPEHVRTGIEELERGGFLETTDGAIAYRRPEVPVADMARHTLARAIDALVGAAGDVDQALEALPALIQAWDTGGTSERTISGEVMHAQAGPSEAWMQHFARDTPQACDMCLPDLAQLLTTARDLRVADWTAQAMAALHVRIIITEAAARDPDLQPALARIEARSIPVRCHPDPPSFFWVSDRTTAGLPLHWGEPWPTSVLTVRSGPVAEALAARFEQLWETASPIQGAGPDWEPMLTLMNSGMTMEAAALRLGMAHRTARRRVAEAMAHYGATSQFALGAAWGRDHRSRAS